MAKLSPFDGREVLGAGVTIRNAGDGLSQAMGVDPVELHHSEEVTIAVRCVVDKVRFDPVKDTEGLRRIHVLKAGDASIIDDALVAEALDAQRVKIEEARGVKRLPFDPDNPEGGDDEGDESGGSVTPIGGGEAKPAKKSAPAKATSAAKKSK